ncbi:class I SAM-dependent methyltransferase [Aggregicoccus sp. 17bor-14]|uniref:class I SAM-dependent methyltransferase n=1 Tax=Myxococcaceae TaxID=31 RepID=UPI00129C55A4|nr:MULTISPECIES: class I SAM-dependent methyltransferase [Myxococcaceae]MBF5043609.1 class I SAM-dependent methyltransferase [Simulacricoccus sp. 17bor-14]MRI89368.1 class I SAM-dependent methyltransferase [Aggregicoccus sp. 17bor-14]
MAGNDARGGRTPLSLVGPEADLAFYARLAAERAAGGPVLVLGSATGRVAWDLAERGLSVVGVDPSERMVQGAEERRANVGAEASARARFLAADVRGLRLGERFPLVLAPQNALGLMATLEDLEAFLTTVRLHLAPGGTFAFDVLNPPRPPEPDDDAEPTAGLEPQRLPFAFHLRERTRAGQAGGIRRLRLQHFSPEELDRALAACGLTARERYGRFDGKPFDADDPRHIGVAGL